MPLSVWQRSVSDNWNQSHIPMDMSLEKNSLHIKSIDSLPHTSWGIQHCCDKMQEAPALNTNPIFQKSC